MSEFTERLMDYGLTLDEDVIICDRRVVDQAADMIDELERALKICGNAFEHLGIGENQIIFYAPTAIREALVKLERL